MAMWRFWVTTLGMVTLLALGLSSGGHWTTAALLYLTVFTFFMDKITALSAPNAPKGMEFPTQNGLLIFLGVSHFSLLFWGIQALSTEDSHTLVEKLILFVALALFFGQVSNSNAHELIHKPARDLRLLGTGVYSSLLFGHHVSAHLRVHHVYAATPDDPNSARLNQGFYRFAAKAWVGSFIAGLAAERRLRDQNAKGVHPYIVYATLSTASVLLSFGLAGWTGLLIHVALASYAQLQLLLSDYVQHYGLHRRKQTNEKWEPVGPQHSWNAPNWFSSGMMLNAPRHSDHHARPARPYPALELQDTMPMLPYSLPFMAVIALVPPLWRRLMDPKARAWNGAAPPIT